MHRTSVFLAGAATTLLLLYGSFFFFLNLDSISRFCQPKLTPPNYNHTGYTNPAIDLEFDPPDPTFYDDPTFGYTVDITITNWDENRQTWLRLHPTFEPRSRDRVLIVTGSRSTPCTSPKGDHFILRLFRNKVDYCRIHGYDIFYNNVLLHPKMHTWWGKLPAVRAAMVAHPEAEWIWWLDEDTAITDMEFKIPLHRYKDLNFIVHGYPHFFEKKDWVALNSGSFLIRNCQWSLDFLDKWADMGPQSENFDKWADILFKTFNHESNDQTALGYLVLQDQEPLGANKTLMETAYLLEGYWGAIVETLKNVTDRYLETENGTRVLRRRHAEKVSEVYGVLRQALLKDEGYWLGSLRRPFVTHFPGCKPCLGTHNREVTSDESCWRGMDMILNFADNQVLRSYGYVHMDLSDSSVVSPVPFDYPAVYHEH